MKKPFQSDERAQPARPLPKAWAEEVRKACEVMRRGGVILYPTDTIWGIGCDATNAEAVRRVYEIKRRADSKALIVLVDSEARLQRYVAHVPDVAWDMMDFSERPLTVIFDGARNLAPNLVADDGSIAIRMTREAFSRELCYRFQKAVVSTSANVSGEPSPACFADIDEEIRSAVDYVVAARQNERNKGGKPSSIVKLTASGEVQIIRK